MDQLLKCDRSNESFWTVLSCHSVYYAVEGVKLYNLWIKLECDRSNKAMLSGSLPSYNVLHTTVLTFESADW